MTVQQITDRLMMIARRQRTRHQRGQRKAATKASEESLALLGQLLEELSEIGSDAANANSNAEAQKLLEYFRLYYPTTNDSPQLTPADVEYLYDSIAVSLDILEITYNRSVEKKPLNSPSIESPVWSAEESQDNLQLSVAPGTASPEEIAELLAEISRIYRKAGGSGITFRLEDATIKEEELA